MMLGSDDVSRIDRSATVDPVAPSLTIPGLVELRAAEQTTAIALEAGDVRVTYTQLWGLARRLAGSLVGVIGLGDRVAIWGPNSIDWAVASLGVLFAGGAVVPLNSRYTTPEAGDIVSRAACRVVFAEHAFADRRLAAEAQAFAPDAMVVGLGPGAETGVASCADLIQSGPASPDAVDARLRTLTPDHISHLQFTSGTTGRPKGAMLRHRAMVQTTADWAGVVGLRSGDRYPVIAPFSHIGGHKTGLLASITAGATALPFAAFDLDRLIAAIDHQGATVLQGPPTMFHGLVARARDDHLRFPALRVAVTGPATVAPSLIRDMHDVLGIDNVFTSYGLSESTGVCTITRPGDPPELVAETSGRPIPGVEVDIVDDQGQPITGNRQGEIVVRGINVMAGYLDDPDATRQAIRRGWLHTGDVGWIGPDGYLRIVDRLKDMIIVGGFNVYPAEIEQALLEHPDIDQAAVIGIPHQALGEVPAAYIVLRSDATTTTAALQHFAAQRLANFKLPRTLWIVATLPLNSAGKVLKAELRTRAAAHHHQ